MPYQAMTKSRWLEIVANNADKLRQLVADYHPSARSPRREHYMPITAEMPEAACENVRQKIRQEELSDPLVRWDKAVAGNDIGEINSLLSSAWFGVPECTECWSIPGFGVACDLMDDLPKGE